MKHIVYVKHSPDDELVCSKHVEDSVNETNEVNKVCILLVLLTIMSHFVYETDTGTVPGQVLTVCSDIHVYI